MSTADDKKVSPESAASAAQKPASVPPTADLEAAERKDLDETEALLSGFDRSPRRPKRAEKRDSGRDFVAHFSGKADVQPPPAPEKKEPDPARNAPTFIVPREPASRPWLTWALVVAAMLLVGWFAATGIIRAVAKTDTPTEAPTVATTTVTLAPASAPPRVDPVPAPDPADVAPASPPTVEPPPPGTARAIAPPAKGEPSAAPHREDPPRPATTTAPTTSAPEPRPAPPPPAVSPARSNGYIPEL